MDKGAIKNFATTARRKLIEAIKQKAFELGITKDAIQEPDVYKDGFLIHQKFYKQYEIKQREKLIRTIEQKGYDYVIDEVAYTWFNRFIALRFMEVNDYLPTGVRIFSSIEPGKTEPDAMTDVLMLVDDLDLDEAKVHELQDANDDEDLFKYILIRQCNKLGEIMPEMFEQIEDYTELLLPNQLLAEKSVIGDMVRQIEENDWTEEVEIIGWLYQYYISEKKDDVFAALNKNQKISKENIPAATQLFTPRWIVQYMVENSLGRLWLESHPDPALQENFPYYLEASEQPDYVIEQLDALKDADLRPESITFFDPSMGSGHILVYAFEVFYQLYQSQGYRGQDIPKMILENNLFGLDIDPRAAQLAYFSVMMKARSYNRIFATFISTHIHWVEESNVISQQDNDIFAGDTDLREDIDALAGTFIDGRMFGSIVQIPDIDLTGLKERADALKETVTDDLFMLEFKERALPVIERLIEQAFILLAKYDVVVTNPPYMGRKGMDDELSKYVKKYFPTTNGDLFAVMMDRIEKLVSKDGFSALVTMQSWMFLSSYEKYRRHLLKNFSIITLTHMANNVMGIAFGTAATVFRKKINDYNGVFQYISYEDIIDEKPFEFPVMNKRYSTISDDVFSDIPGSPIAYWATDQVRKIFREGSKLSEHAKPKHGMSTGKNTAVLRSWNEVNENDIGYKLKSNKEVHEKKYKYVPYNKGGSFRKWYGNNYNIIRYDEYGKNLMNTFSGHRHDNFKYYFKSGITWSFISSSNFGARFSPTGFVFDVAGSSLFPGTNKMDETLSFLASKVAPFLLSILNPTLNFQVGNIGSLPVLNVNQHETKEQIKRLSQQNISISKSDWDSFETSWDFKTHPFPEFQQGTAKISEAFQNWQQEAEDRFQTLKANEEELNRIFIDLYGLQDELTPEEDDKDVTVNRADQLRDVKSFLSYAVGVMFGRYSLDEEGLVFAGGDFSLDNYQTFQPDTENIIPITDDAYFEDDIVTRFIDFLKMTFGDDYLEANLDFLADTLTRKSNETSRQRIRRYFLKEFYKDHVKTYQNRPIYWLFDSGKQNGFKALIYLHRYQPGLVARVRTDYLHAQQRKYEEEMERQDMLLEADIAKQEQTQAKKRKETLQKQLLECQRYDQLIAHVANQRIELDLDDGVKFNHAQFQNIEIPQGEGKQPIKGNVLAKI